MGGPCTGNPVVTEIVFLETDAEEVGQVRGHVNHGSPDTRSLWAWPREDSREIHPRGAGGGMNFLVSFYHFLIIVPIFDGNMFLFLKKKNKEKLRLD